MPNTIDEKMVVPGEFRVISYDMPEFAGDYSVVSYGDPNAARIAELLGEFGIEAVVDGYETEWEQIRALKRWVRSRWNHGWSPAFATVKDGLDILREAAKGEQFACGHYAMVFNDCATGLGWPTRMVGLSIEHPEFPRDYNLWNVGHVLLEVWSNDFAKWVILDPDANIHYELGGVPLNALDIRDAWLGGYAEEVDMAEEEPEFVYPAGKTLEYARLLGPDMANFDEELSRLTLQRFTRHRVMDYYAHVNIAGMEFVDGRALPTFVRHFEPWGGARWTSDVAAMNWTVNMARVVSASPSWDESGARLSLTLAHCMPYFSHFEVAIDEADWQRCEAKLDWPMREGVNRLELRPVNIKGCAGIGGSVEVAYATARW
jgi:hypothetical protein